MQLPIGISNFREMIEYRNHYTGEPYLYVDKTRFVRDIDADGAKVIIITRPRRFGKTINLSMLQHFYAPEVEGVSTANLFAGLEISKCKDVMQKQGAHPVLSISFKGVDGSDFENSKASLSSLLSFTYAKYCYLLNSDKLEPDEKAKVKFFITKEGSFVESDFQTSLQRLTFYLEKHFGKKVIVLIDEYDAPIQKAYSKKYYEQIIAIFGGMFGELLKENNSLHKAVLTGILRISCESLFSALNNVNVYSLLHAKYSEYFGFTETEVEKLFVDQSEASVTVVKEWYNGYKFGDSVVYNPWSIINYIYDDFELKSYWVNTSSNKLVKDLLLNSKPKTKQKIETLMQNKNITELIDEHVVFKDLDKNESALWSLLLASGYLMSTKKTPEGRYYNCFLQIPNKEVLDFYCSTVKVWISSAGGITWFRKFVAALMSGAAIEIEKRIQDVMDNTMSYHDKARNVHESFFHGLMLGVVVGLKDDYTIKSNRESGLGRYDVALFPNDKNKPGIIMEFKAENTDEDTADKLAQAAVKQLNNKEYVRELTADGITNIISLGVGFTKHKVKVLEA